MTALIEKRCPKCGEENFIQIVNGKGMMWCSECGHRERIVLEDLIPA